ncbi:DivIVA domain-containing protein [uncultured Schumannella sp.]|uniref:DivIVA domain-containing protein n=1 Tax=uncultured Schumannella sp. TaxID=1195956 RepID=UPI00341D6365
MALTPEDVVNKRFQPTKFREGYDQDEVDDFLDEVVVELRRLNQENEELRQRLVASDNKIAELQRSGAAPAAPVAPAPAPAAAPMAAPMPTAVPEPQFAQSMDPNPMDPGNTNNLLQLARRLHEEHVREGMEKRDQLVAEGQAQAARIVAEAEQSQREQIGQLQQEHAMLERKVEELRIFEREYREKLKGYIEGQLRELESTNALNGQSAPQSAPTPPAPQQPYAEQPPQPYTGPSAPQQTYPAQPAAPQQAPSAPQGYPAPSNDFAAYPQPTEYPGFGGN